MSRALGTGHKMDADADDDKSVLLGTSEGACSTRVLRLLKEASHKIRLWRPLKSLDPSIILAIGILGSIALLLIVGVFWSSLLGPGNNVALFPANDLVFGPPRLNHLNRVVYLVWIGTKPLRSVGLAAVDSVARHLPRWSVEVHFTKESGIPDDIYAVRKKHIEQQMKYFKDRGQNITAIIHEDIHKELSGTVFDRLNIEQKHVGGQYGVKYHWTFPAHAAGKWKLRTLDILDKHTSIQVLLSLRPSRCLPWDSEHSLHLLTILLYMDEDNILLKDFTPLFAYYGPTILVSGEKNETISFCKERWPVNGWYSHAPNHPFFVENARRVINIIKTRGADCALIYNVEVGNPGETADCFWTMIGPRPFEKSHFFMCDTNPPEIVNKLPSDLSSTANNKSLPLNVRRQHPIYAFVARGQMMPGHWEEPDYLIEQDRDRVTRYLKDLADAYQFHIFGHLKDDFLKYLRKASDYPVLDYVYKTSCLHLCNVEAFDYLLNPNPESIV